MSENSILANAGQRYAEARTSAKDRRQELDDAVRVSRDDGTTYSAIAKDIGMSVAWVQASLWRTSPDEDEPEPEAGHE